MPKKKIEKIIKNKVKNKVDKKEKPLVIPVKEKKTHSLYREELCDMLIDHMAEGLSFESFAGIVGCHHDRLFEWCKIHPEFQEAKQIGVSKSLLYWEKEGRRQVSGAQFSSSTSFIFIMKNKFSWCDQPQGKPLAPEEPYPKISEDEED